MFGAEQILMNRAVNRGVFDDVVTMINAFKEYYLRHGQVIYENPSPGNKAGGITTLEEKSLGCIQKGGTAPVMAVLDYAQRCTAPGLNLLTGPGNDIVSCTNLAASGAHIIAFTTGRGTRYQYLLPTTKYVTFVARSKDLATWELSPTRGPMLDPTPGEGINNTDADLFEYEGNTYIYYATGEQTVEWGTIRVAMYAGPMKEMFEAYFPNGAATIKFDARRRKYIDPR